MSSLISLMIYLTTLINLYFQPLRKRINNGCTYTVKASGNLISSAAEFTAGMKHSKNNLNCRYTCLGVKINRHSTSVIDNGDGIVLIYLYLNGSTESCQGFIDGVVYDLIDQMMKSSVGCRSNIHTRSFADCFQSLQNLYLFCTVV